MNNVLFDSEDMLDRAVPGFHQYLLAPAVRLCRVSPGLCAMTGYGPDELAGGGEDGYAGLVHPADRPVYDGLLRRLGAGEGQVSADYRLIRKDGTVLWVRDTLTRALTADGTPGAWSALTDITDLKKENHDLRFLNDTIPCGFLKYTCEKQPRVTYINQQMMDFLRFPRQREGELDYLELYKGNVFLMVPIEDRPRFARYLDRVSAAGAPLAGEMTLLRCDGTRVHVFGWVTRCLNEQGEYEFQSVCMDVSERHQARKETERRSYLDALTDVYDMIFEFDLAAGTVKCLHSSNSPTFRMMENIPMQMEDATQRWVDGIVAAADREAVRSFIRTFGRDRLDRPGEKPPQITYHARTSTGEMKAYTGIFLKIGPEVSFYCCRKMPESGETDHLKSENASLRENLQELLLRFTDGAAAFEVKDDQVTPLYASDNVLEFFGMTREEWMPLMERPTPIRDFIARSAASPEHIRELLESGEAEFTYFDLKTESERRIKAICSRKTPGGSLPRYIMLYNVDGQGERADGTRAGAPRVTIRTFGYFDVFVDGRPIAFRNKKSKELFALLVDRKGGFVTSEEAIGFLWEDEPVSPVTLARYRKVALRLKNILEEYGIAPVMETVDGKRRVVLERVRCDLYDYLSGGEEHTGLFKGSYLTNYSWGETTLAELTGGMV